MNSRVKSHQPHERYVAATAESYLSKAVNIYTSGDMNAFKKLLNSTPNIFPLEEGVKVYLEETKLNGHIKIRPLGSTTSVWTISDAIY